MENSMTDEYLIYGTASTGPKDDGNIVTTTLNAGGNLRTFKQAASQVNKIAVLDSGIFTAHEKKPIIYVYSYAKEGPVQKLFVPEKLSCISASHSGTYLAAGTPGGKLILWDVRFSNFFSILSI